MSEQDVVGGCVLLAVRPHESGVCRRATPDQCHLKTPGRVKSQQKICPFAVKSRGRFVCQARKGVYVTPGITTLSASPSVHGV